MTTKGSTLVGDDNRLVLATLTDGLSRAGYHVIDADNGDPKRCCREWNNSPRPDSGELP